jgi:hypothetical protein
VRETCRVRWNGRLCCDIAVDAVKFLLQTCGWPIQFDEGKFLDRIARMSARQTFN